MYLQTSYMTELRNCLCADLYINTYLWQCLDIYMCVNVAYKILSMMELEGTCMYLPIMKVRNKYLCLCTCWCICDRSRKHMLWPYKQRLIPGKARKPCICKLAPVGIPVRELENSCLWTPMAWLRNICVWTYTCAATHVQLGIHFSEHSHIGLPITDLGNEHVCTSLHYYLFTE